MPTFKNAQDFSYLTWFSPKKIKVGGFCTGCELWRDYIKKISPQKMGKKPKYTSLYYVHTLFCVKSFNPYRAV